MLVLKYLLVLAGIGLFGSAAALVIYDIYIAAQLRRLLRREAAAKAAAAAAAAGETTFEVLGVRPTRRVAPDGSFRTEVIATIMQRQSMVVDPNDDPNEPTAPLCSGS